MDFLTRPISRRHLLATSALAGTASLLGSRSLLAQTSTPPASPQASPTAFTLVNLNTATEDELMTIPGMSARMVDEFMEYRPYVSIVQFREEIGKYVDDKQVAAYEAFVFVPIVPNDADAETLKQLPGVDDDIAQALIDGRDYQDNQEFLDTLATLVSAQDAALAHYYLEPDGDA